jgi:hypothetical protein
MMKSMRFCWSTMLFALSLLWFSSCKKIEVEEPVQQGSPIFTVDTQLGDDKFVLSAGNDGCELNVGSEYVNGVQCFTGTLSDGESEISLAVMDGKLDLPMFEFQSGLTDNLPYLFEKDKTLAELSLDHFPNAKNIQQIKWFVDGVFYGLNDLKITEPGVYSTCALVTFLDGSYESVCNELIIGYKKSAVAILENYVDMSGYLHAWIDADLIDVASVKWSLDDVVVCNEEILLHQLSPKTHKITAEITFANGAKRKRTVLVDGACKGNFLNDFTCAESLISSSNNDFNVRIDVKWNGSVYSSKLVQNDSGKFQITDMKYYGKDAKGNKIYKIDALINCMLSTKEGNQIPFSGKLSMGIPVK